MLINSLVQFMEAVRNFLINAPGRYHAKSEEVALKHFEVRFVRFDERVVNGFSSLGVPDMGL